jgi:hypothetical protein
MPLLDPFHPPLKGERHWESMHSAWANSIVIQLNESVLPADYFAEPQVKIGMPIEVDVGTFDGEQLAEAEENGGVATAIYAPPKATMSVAVDFAEIDTFEVNVYQDGGRQLVAAIELVSPANKDRPTHRHAFATKCAALLQKGVCVVIVDIVTDRSANLHAELLEELAPTLDTDLNEPDALYAVTYRVQAANRLEAWPERLEVSRNLPTLPLWLTDVLAVPVDLEACYRAACKALRIPMIRTGNPSPSAP